MQAKLKYPHVRLMVYGSLADPHSTCLQAIVTCAHRMALIEPDRLTDLRLPAGTTDCGSMFAAEQVLKQCIQERGGDEELVLRLWKDVQRLVEQYKSDNSLVHIPVPGTVNAFVECGHMAPMVMDALLQVLQPYV